MQTAKMRNVFAINPLKKARNRCLKSNLRDAEILRLSNHSRLPVCILTAEPLTEVNHLQNLPASQSPSKLLLFLLRFPQAPKGRLKSGSHASQVRWLQCSKEMKECSPHFLEKLGSLGSSENWPIVFWGNRGLSPYPVLDRTHKKQL